MLTLEENSSHVSRAPHPAAGSLSNEKLASAVPVCVLREPRYRYRKVTGLSGLLRLLYQPIHLPPVLNQDILVPNHHLHRILLHKVVMVLS